MNVRFLGLLIVSCAALVFGSAYAQQPKSAAFKVQSGLFIFEKIEPVELSKKEIVANSAAFLAEKFKSSKSVIELRDDEIGKIVGDVILRNPKAKFLSAFPAVKARIIIDARTDAIVFKQPTLSALMEMGMSLHGQLKEPINTG